MVILSTQDSICELQTIFHSNTTQRTSSPTRKSTFLQMSAQLMCLR
jgi:hypothetical protein